MRFRKLLDSHIFWIPISTLSAMACWSQISTSSSALFPLWFTWVCLVGHIINVVLIVRERTSSGKVRKLISQYRNALYRDLREYVDSQEKTPR